MDAFESLGKQLDQLTSCKAMTWSNMLTMQSGQCHRHAAASQAARLELQIPNFMFYVDRYLLEIMEPKAKTSDEEAFGSVLKVQEQEKPKAKYSLDRPSWWLDHLPDSVSRASGPGVFSSVIGEGLFLSILQKSVRVDTTASGDDRGREDKVELVPPSPCKTT